MQPVAVNPEPALTRSELIADIAAGHVILIVAAHKPIRVCPFPRTPLLCGEGRLLAEALSARRPVKASRQKGRFRRRWPGCVRVCRGP